MKLPNMESNMNNQQRKCSRRNYSSYSYIGLSTKKLACVLFLLTFSLSLIEGSHLPASYIKDSIRKAEENSHQHKSISLQPNGHLSTSSSVSSSPPTTNSLYSNEEERTTGSQETTDQLDYFAGPTTVLLEQGYHKDDSMNKAQTSEEDFISTTSLSSGRFEYNSNDHSNTKPKLIKQDDEVSTMSSSLDKSELEDVRSDNEALNSGTSYAPPKDSRPTPIVSTGSKLEEEKQETKNTLSAEGKRYHSLEATCNEKLMKITGNFVSKFKGRIYAYGYPDEPECGVRASTSNPDESPTLILPLGECGVQMLPVDPELEDIKRHEVTLYIQYSSFLQQIIDDKVTVNCVEVPKSPVGDDGLQSLEFEEPTSSTRQGRRMNSPKGTGGGAQTKITSKIGESWMEILAGKDPSPKSRKISPVAVGQDVTLVISTKVMRGYDARIVNCTANDGSRLGTIDGYRSQQILDSAGCSVDTSLVPNFRRRRLPIESRNRMITLHFATFPAFKFPERDHLHVKCIVAYCQGPCPQEPCDSGVNHFGTWREKYGRIADALIDTTEIVNSVEVTAPDLDDNEAGGGHYFERHQSDPASLPKGGSATDVSSRQFNSESHARSHSYSGDSSPHQNSNDNGIPTPSFNVNGGNVCVSPGSVILALVILGVVLVISATATLWFALKRSEHKKYRQTVKHTPFQHGPQPYYRFSQW